MTRNLFLSVLALSLCMSLSAQKTCYYDAASLNVIGKAIPTSKDYTRIDTSAYKFNDAVIEEFACHSTGLAVLFATDSPFIKARWQTSPKNASENMTAIAQKAFLGNFSFLMLLLSNFVKKRYKIPPKTGILIASGIFKNSVMLRTMLSSHYFLYYIF